MKPFILILLLLTALQGSFAQPMNNTKYADRWESVDKAFKKGLNATAEKEITEILKLAKTEKNTEQILKALCRYRLSLQRRDETARLNDLIFFEAELKDAVFPAKQVLHSMLGELYWTYYEENSWLFLDRTQVETKKPYQAPKADKDLETWSANDFFRAVYFHFTESLREADLLKKESVNALSEMVLKGQKTEKLRPTLFDFLAHRAIDYFKREENEVTRPAFRFEMNDARAFAKAEEFIQARFETPDSMEQKFQVLRLYQELLRFHLKDADPAALIDVDLARIQYVQDVSSLPEKNDKYRAALEHILQRFPEQEQAALANFLLAETYTQTGKTFGRKAGYTDDSKANYVEAKKCCDAIVEKFPESEAAFRANTLLQQIEQRILNLNTEKVVLPNAPFLAKVFYKNIPAIYCKLVRMTPAELREKTYDNNNDYQVVASRDGITSWSVSLPDLKDYKQHSTEIKVNALPLGSYALVVSEDPQFDKKKHYSVNFIQVSELAYVYASNRKENGTGAYVLHRETGEPLGNVQINTWTIPYDYNARKYIPKQGAVYTTDKDGFFRLVKTENFQSAYTIECIRGKDVLYLDDNMYINELRSTPRDYMKTYFFTDRSLYRPGQTIWFKGIMVNSKFSETNSHHLLKDRVTTVKLRDVNGQIVKEMTCTSNAYGSFSGSFTAPEGLLTGEFSIVGENGMTSFNIEEYKRPTFEVRFDSMKGSYRLKEEVNVKGIAKAYAGQSIDGASVSYRVVREARFPYWWCFYRWGQPSSPSVEIAHGNSSTKSDGSFDIRFAALPDESVDPQTMPVFTYTVYADVTDRNGETRSGSESFSVAYYSLMLNIESPEQTEWSTWKEVNIRSSNLAGSHIPAKVTLILKKLKAPDKTYRSRLWSKADLVSIPEEQFRKDFPLDEFASENDYQQWKEEATVWTETLQTSADGTHKLPNAKLSEGWYVLEATANDAYGAAVTDKKFIRLTSFANPQALSNEHLLLTRVKTRAQPGETARLGFSTPFEKVHLLYGVERRGQTSKNWLPFSTRLFRDYNISEEDRGGFYVSAVYVKNNRFYQQSQFIDIPWTNKELNISLETFRDHMLPGSEQEWTVKISPKAGAESQWEKTGAELLTTLYDASLDAFKPHVWNGLYLFRSPAQEMTWNSASNFQIESGRSFYFGPYRTFKPYVKTYHELNWWGLTQSRRALYARNIKYSEAVSFDEISEDSKPSPAPTTTMNKGKADAIEMEKVNAARQSQIAADSTSTPPTAPPPPLRSNFAETAFFFPQLHTDAQGNVLLKFKAPESLTKWNFMALAHTQNLASGQLTASSTTSKDLMIQPNTPRFLREGDRMTYTAKVVNLSKQSLSGTAVLELRDALTQVSVDDLFGNQKNNAAFTLKPGESQAVEWDLRIPEGFTNPVQVATYARTPNLSDGEQHILPLVLNSMLVTETLPLPVRAKSSKEFSFTNLLRSAGSNTLRHHSLTVEYTANPAWYAVQSLPYLTDYPYECAEQTFNRYYANALASHIANSNPKIKDIFSRWEDRDSNALLSNLEKNLELKSALLQETPWVMEAKNEKDQKKQIALLFNLQRMSRELERTLHELSTMQTPNGGFTWFKGMPDDRFVTQYIITGFGRLLHLGLSESGSDDRVKNMISRALPYLDARLKEDYDYLLRNKINLGSEQINYFQIQYLYMRSFFPNQPVSAESRTAFEYYKSQAATYWLKQSLYMQGMTALALHRLGDKNTAQDIVKSLRENAIRSEEMGMYWKNLNASYWWYEAPIETQSLMVEVFKEVAESQDETDELKIWLLKNKQTTHWKTTKATADACYALLLNGSYWLAAEPEVSIQLGQTSIESRTQKQEAGTGYFKTTLPASEVKAEQGKIRVNVNSAKEVGTTWGAVYWQYFEQLDKIPASATPLQLKKQLYRQVHSDAGEILQPITEGDPLKVGDKVKVRIELRVDRPMEYVHLKDMRGACFEPMNVLSGYRYQGGLGYYEATKDLATNFFFHYLQKGTYVFEYPMFVTHRGNYSNGIATIQCMYAPEFSSHSEGIRVKVE